LLKIPGQYFIIINALNECNLQNSQRKDICEILTEMNRWKLANFHVLVTSRKETDLARALEPLVTFAPIDIQAEVVAPDILKYVRTTLSEHERLQKYSAEVKTEIEKSLVGKAEGM
jgi:hypothetical protein